MGVVLSEMGDFDAKDRMSMDELKNNQPSAIINMDSTPKNNVLAMTDAYRKVWLSNAYTSMKMLKEILAVNDCDIFTFLERTISGYPGSRLRQLGMRNIPDDPKIMESTYQSMGGLCTAFTLKVIVESERLFNEFTIGTNKIHRLAWDNDHLLICSSKKNIMVMDSSNFGEKGFTDPTLTRVRKL